MSNAKKPTHRIVIKTGEYEKDGAKKSNYTTIGAAWTHTPDNGEPILNIKLEFPVGATELTLFPITD